jgi:hypothetical protein
MQKRMQQTWTAFGAVAAVVLLLSSPPTGCRCSAAFLEGQAGTSHGLSLCRRRQQFGDSPRLLPRIVMGGNGGGDRDGDGNGDDDDEDPLRDNLGRQLRGLQATGLKGTITVGDTVVCRNEIPSLGIWEGRSYQLRSIYAQKFVEERQVVERVALRSMDDPVPPGYDRYVTLSSPVYITPSGGKDATFSVIVTPEEVGLVSVRRELTDSLWLALPGLFWVFVAASFYNYYHERTGGTFLDAFWGR